MEAAWSGLGGGSGKDWEGSMDLEPNLGSLAMTVDWCIDLHGSLSFLVKWHFLPDRIIHQD